MDEEEKPSTSTATSVENPPLSNLRRFDGTDALLSDKLRNGSSNLEFRHSFTANLNQEADDPYFDSSDYRCCLGLFHAKIAAFIFCTWIFHEIVGGIIYLCSQLETANTSTRYIALLIVCRLAQMPTVALMYLGLWRHRVKLLIPFALVQLTIGTFVDLSTLHMLIDHVEQMRTIPMFVDNDLRWLNFALPTLIYLLGVLWLAWVLYKCYMFLTARNAHDEKRQQQRQLLLQHQQQQHQQQHHQRDSTSTPSSPNNGVVEVIQEEMPTLNGSGNNHEPKPELEQDSLLAQSSV